MTHRYLKFGEFSKVKCPPGMEDWVSSNKRSYQEKYGHEWEMYLMSAAWTIYNRQWKQKPLDM